MTHPSSVYLRSHRKRWQLSQEALADLLGTVQSTVSRYEEGEITPDLRLVLALQVIFNASPRALFPSAYVGIEEAVMARGAALYKQLEGRSDHPASRMRRLLEAMMRRATKTPEAA
jgi:transcriptional regulator with XRE-family HTH domain